MKNTLFMALVASTFAAALAGRGNSPNKTALGHVDLRLTDAPGDFEQVNVVVSGVSIHRSGGGWETVSQDQATYDLLQLQNGVSTTLASSDVPAGHYTQIRLMIGEGSNVVVNGESHPVRIPSGLQSGYKLIGEFDVPEGGTIGMTIDFDAAKSIIQETDGTYMLRPTVRLVQPQ